MYVRIYIHVEKATKGCERALELAKLLRPDNTIYVVFMRLNLIISYDFRNYLTAHIHTYRHTYVSGVA